MENQNKQQKSEVTIEQAFKVVEKPVIEMLNDLIIEGSTQAANLLKEMNQQENFENAKQEMMNQFPLPGETKPDEKEPDISIEDAFRVINDITYEGLAKIAIDKKSVHAARLLVKQKNTIIFIKYRQQLFD